MRSVVQRVTRAGVMVDGSVIASIESGLLVLVGFHRDDGRQDLEYTAQKILGLRIFDDEGGIMNRALPDVGGDLLLVSQFTLYGDARRSRRPSYSEAMAPADAEMKFNEFVSLCRSQYQKVHSGSFGAHMEVSIVNSGPVTILLESKKLF